MQQYPPFCRRALTCRVSTQQIPSYLATRADDTGKTENLNKRVGALFHKKFIVFKKQTQIMKRLSIILIAAAFAFGISSAFVTKENSKKPLTTVTRYEQLSGPASCVQRQCSDVSNIQFCYTTSSSNLYQAVDPIDGTVCVTADNTYTFRPAP